MEQLIFYFTLMVLASIPWFEASFAVPVAVLAGATAGFAMSWNVLSLMTKPFGGRTVGRSSMAA